MIGRERRLPAHPEELAYPCCLPALGEFGEVPPHGEPAPSVRDSGSAKRSRWAPWPIPPRRAFRVSSGAEDSPSGLWRSLGKRVGLTALAGSNPASSATLTSTNASPTASARGRCDPPGLALGLTCPRRHP